ncbi:28S ribosomal protein S22, mitochondrial [Diorhabda sublineata]|uniref:28S ribosomal protein S22, mitochondrial n=1 Tax=Diorhabda sublineata TaxID=1163346 RepID=UPI0024E133B3|nr:28S ribosomal protein S22, mitochondrial [Diorhabda sublineata]
MAALRHISHKIIKNVFKPDIRLNIETCALCTRLLHYSPIEYDQKHDPAPKFFNTDIQNLLRELTRIDLSKVFKKRKLGTEGLEDPEYKFLTDEELKQAYEEAHQKSYELLQIPPIVAARKPKDRILSYDPALQGLEESKMVFTDISFGVRDADRIIVVRDPDGTLREADWELRGRMNQLYFPQIGRSLKPPRMFFGEYFDSLLERKEYIFILDRACIQFEPDDPDYQRVVSVTYQHINDHNGFDILRSTRHFGALVFFLVWNKNIDNLLLELIETCHINEAGTLLNLFSNIHNVVLEKSDEIFAIEDYINKFANKKAALQLGLQAYKDLAKEKNRIEEGIKIAHGIR